MPAKPRRIIDSFAVVGFFGVGMLGLIIGVIAQNVALERGGPTTTLTSLRV